jgi:RNA polymerase sigma-70 factor, ECF subfamily
MTDTANRDVVLAICLPALGRTARRLARSREEAEDLVQETVLRVWARMAGGGEVRALRPYLFATLRYLASRPIDRPEPLPDEETAEAGGPDAEERLAAKEVLLALGRLPREQAILIRSLAVDGVSYGELARRHGLPLGTVMSRVARGRARLARGLGLPPEAPVSSLLAGRLSP